MCLCVCACTSMQFYHLQVQAHTAIVKTLNIPTTARTPQVPFYDHAQLAPRPLATTHLSSKAKTWLFQKCQLRSSCHGSDFNSTRFHEEAGWIPGLTHWLRIQHCCELQCRSQMLLGSGIAVAVASVGQ